MKIKLEIVKTPYIWRIATYQKENKIVYINIRRGDGIICHICILGFKALPRIDNLSIKGYRIITKIKRKQREFQQETNDMIRKAKTM